jgi:hypothetical protein
VVGLGQETQGSEVLRPNFVQGHARHITAQDSSWLERQANSRSSDVQFHGSAQS